MNEGLWISLMRKKLDDKFSCCCEQIKSRDDNFYFNGVQLPPDLLDFDDNHKLLFFFNRVISEKAREKYIHTQFRRS